MFNQVKSTNVIRKTDTKPKSTTANTINSSTTRKPAHGVSNATKVKVQPPNRSTSNKENFKGRQSCSPCPVQKKQPEVQKSRASFQPTFQSGKRKYSQVKQEEEKGVETYTMLEAKLDKCFNNFLQNQIDQTAESFSSIIKDFSAHPETKLPITYSNVTSKLTTNEKFWILWIRSLLSKEDLPIKTLVNIFNHSFNFVTEENMIKSFFIKTMRDIDEPSLRKYLSECGIECEEGLIPNKTLFALLDSYAKFYVKCEVETKRKKLALTASTGEIFSIPSKTKLYNVIAFENSFEFKQQEDKRVLPQNQMTILSPISSSKDEVFSWGPTNAENESSESGKQNETASFQSMNVDEHKKSTEADNSEQIDQIVSNFNNVQVNEEENSNEICIEELPTQSSNTSHTESDDQFDDDNSMEKSNILNVTITKSRNEIRRWTTKSKEKFKSIDEAFPEDIVEGSIRQFSKSFCGSLNNTFDDS